MLDSRSLFRLGPYLAVYLNWAAHTNAFVKELQRRLQTAEVAGTQAKEHMVEAASMVLGTIEQFDNCTAHVLTDLYRFSGQLPALGDRLLVGLLVLRVDERQFLANYPSGVEQVQVRYSLCVERVSLRKHYSVIGIDFSGYTAYHITI
jgi:hypothetical protein